MGAFTVLFVVFSALLVCAAFMGIDNSVRACAPPLCRAYTFILSLTVSTHSRPCLRRAHVVKEAQGELCDPGRQSQLSGPIAFKCLTIS